MKNRAVTDLSALRKNALTLKRLVGEMYCVVKCNAYGHGDRECVSALREIGMTRFAVFSAKEALRIKNAAKDAEILILGRSEIEYTDVICRYGFVQTVASYDYARMLANAPACPKLHVKLDTGMNRSGFSGEDLPDIMSAFKGIEKKIAGAYTHFPNADLADFSDTEKRFYDFLDMTSSLCRRLGYKPLLHAAASPAALHPRFADLPKLDACRIGLALYGILPSDNVPSDLVLTPVMSFYGSVSEVRKVRVGETVGYGGRTVCARDSYIATVSAGYANGLARSLFGRFRPSINDRYVSFAGNICMDRCMLDVTDIIESGGTVKVGDVVTFFDKTHPVTLMSKSLDTISYEILTSVGNLSSERVILNGSLSASF